jgi:tetratricopeptide (TPR) repeat protein
MSGVYPFLLGAVAWVGAGFFLVSYFGLGFFQIVAGNYYAEKGDLEKSRHYFQRAVEIEPEHPDYRFALGNQYLHADRDFEKAILEYKKVVSLDPKHGEAHLALATSYYFLGDFATAKKYLATAETLPLESTDLLTTLKEDENMLP